jgi:iron complex transport system ATP-binding protein
MVNIKVEGVTFSYSSTPALRGVTVEIPPRTFTAVLGPNGSGKTTLLRVMAKILKPHGGAVYVEGREVRKWGNNLYKVLGYVPQRVAPIGRIRVYDFVLSGRKPHMGFLPSAEDYKAVEEALRTVGAWHLKDRVLEELSGGELQLVLIAKALALKPKVLLLDEPLNNLDVKNQLAILRLMRRLSAEASVVAVLHDINMAYRYADYVIFMKKGVIHVAGPTEEVFTEEVIEKIYDVPVKILREHRIVIFDQERLPT